jgi:hypothetical protein
MKERMTVIETGKYERVKGIHYCDCIVGQDPNSHQPHLIRCENVAKWMWYWREYIQEILHESDKPMYNKIGARVCQECFDKIKLEKPRTDLEELREKYKKNKQVK